MPTKHIDEETWKKVEKETVNAVLATKTAIKDTEMLRYLIRKGVREMGPEDYRAIAEEKKR